MKHHEVDLSTAYCWTEKCQKCQTKNPGKFASNFCILFASFTCEACHFHTCTEPQEFSPTTRSSNRRLELLTRGIGCSQRLCSAVPGAGAWCHTETLRDHQPRGQPCRCSAKNDCRLRRFGRFQKSHEIPKSSDWCHDLPRGSLLSLSGLPSGNAEKHVLQDFATLRRTAAPEIFQKLTSSTRILQILSFRHFRCTWGTSHG